MADLESNGFRIDVGDCLAIMRRMPDASVDAVVTDPPAGIAFMGKEWDGNKGGRDQWVAWLTEVMSECLRVLKPGGHALVWALPRTSHWTATALEDAGFELRDVVTHHFGTGFPKSLDVSKQIDKAAGAERTEGAREWRGGQRQSGILGQNLGTQSLTKYDTPATDEAKQWDGWGTALKPSSEHWILCRKPLAEGTVAANVLAHGTGAMNIDACRVPGQPEPTRFNPSKHQHDGWRMAASGEETAHNAAAKDGRWPTNLLLSHAGDCGIECVEACPVAEMDAQSGVSKSAKSGLARIGNRAAGIWADERAERGEPDNAGVRSAFGDSGGASRFFPTFRYQSKPPPSEKKQGAVTNDHPTVKAVELMRWLCRLITPANGIVLDPFAGSGSTGVACMMEGFRFIGLEQDPHFCDLARARIEHTRNKADS